MEYERLGERQRGLRLPVVEVLSALMLLAAIVLGMIEMVKYSNTKDSLATDLTVASIPVGGLSETAARARWEKVYLDQPVQLYFEGSLIELHPVDDAGFTLDSDAMLNEARAKSSRADNFWAGFWNYLWRRPVAAVNVPLRAEYYSYSDTALRKFLSEDLAGYTYSNRSTPPAYNTTTWVFEAGRPGRRLDVDRAMTMVAAALLEPETRNRQVELPVVNDFVVEQQMGMDLLRQAILQLMDAKGFTNDTPHSVTSVYVLDLESGEELTILPDVQHTAASVIKIPIMVNLFRQKLLLNKYEAYHLTASILCSQNSSSNFLMQFAGEGASENAALADGISQVSCTMQNVGADHTYISAPLDLGIPGQVQEVPIACRPADQGNTAYFTDADPWSRTTAEDMGLVLTEIYDCANRGGGLRAIYPDDITQSECQQMIEVMSGNRIDRLIELGVPPGTTVAHKNGWAGGSTSDAAIVFTPGGDYVLVVFLTEFNQAGFPERTLAGWELIEEISRLTYNYFNPDAPLTQRRAPLNEFGAIDCVTVASEDLVDLNDIDANRLDANGNPVPGACYGGPGDCRPFDNWGQE